MQETSHGQIGGCARGRASLGHVGGAAAFPLQPGARGRATGSFQRLVFFFNMLLCYVDSGC